MVRAYTLPFWSWNFSAVASHRSVFDVWRYPDGCTFLYGPGADRTTVRHSSRALARDVSGFSATAGAGIFALLHLAPFQTDTAERHSHTRTFAGRSETRSRPPANFLERRRARPPSF